MKGKSQLESPVGNRLCDVCGMVFSSPTALKEHYLTHALETPRVQENSHACEVCGIDFMEKSDLKEHMQVHTKQKNYECEICKKQFGLLSAVRRHMDTHITLKSRSCKICGENFKSEKDVRKHTQKAHSEEETSRQQEKAATDCSTLSFTEADDDTPKKIHDNDSSPSKHKNKTPTKAVAIKALKNAFDIGHGDSANIESVVNKSDDNLIVLVIRNGEIEKQIAGDEYLNSDVAESKGDSRSRDNTILETDDSDNDEDYDMTETTMDPGPKDDGTEMESDREGGVNDYLEGDDSDDFSIELENDRDYVDNDFHDESNKYSNLLDGTADFSKNMVDEKDQYSNTVLGYNIETETEKGKEKELDKDAYMSLISDERLAKAEETDIFNNKRWKCEICKKVVKHKSTFRDHILIHENVKPFQCELCMKCFRKKANLKEHLLTHGINAGLTIGCHACDICNKTFPRRNILRAHRSNHSDARPFNCGICGRNFKRRSHLKDHMPTHEGKDRKREHICDVCKAGFYNRKMLTRHMRLHFAERRHKCDVCGLAFKRKQHLTDHAIRHQEEREIYHCEDCNKDFTNNKAFKNHLSVHQNEERHTCKFCNKNFTKLNEHLMRMHHGLNHGNQHAVVTLRQPKVTEKSCSTEERPYECSICGQSFKRMCHLKDHSVRHKKDREIYCGKCDKIFTNPRTFKNHMDFHENKDQHKCKFCGKHYTKLNDHVKRTHKGMIETEQQSKKFAVLSKGTVTGESTIKSPVKSNYATRSRKPKVASSLAETEVERKFPHVLKNGDSVDNNDNKGARTVTLTFSSIPDDDVVTAEQVNRKNLGSIHEMEDRKDSVYDSVKQDSTELNSENIDQEEINASSKVETILAIENIENEDKEQSLIFYQPNFEHLLPENFSTTEDIVTSYSPRLDNTCITVYHEDNESSSYEFRRTQQIVDKLARKRSKKPEQLHICDVCGKVFSKRGSLQMHVISHSDQKSYMCEFCGQQYKRKQKLDAHVRKSCKYRNLEREITVYVCK